jgi:hypothetical protein
VGHAERTGELKNAYKILFEKGEGRDRSEDQSEDRRIILKWIEGKCSGTDSSGPG